MVLICIFLMTSDVQHLFLYLLTICMSSLRMHLTLDSPECPPDSAKCPLGGIVALD